MSDENARGLVHVYTGNGKGKTTAALGLALRASGQGLRVGFIQFLKGEVSGEHMFVARYHPFEIVRTSSGSKFTRTPQELKEDARRTLAQAREMMLSASYDLLVLDEVCVAIHEGLIGVDQVLALLKEKPAPLEMVLTGRYAPPELLERADLVTEMCAVKHPFEQGIRGRRGTEY